MKNTVAKIEREMRGNRPAAQKMNKRDLLKISDLSTSEINEVYDASFKLKDAWKKREATPVLKGCTLAMVFEKASLRTRSTFEIGIRQLGGWSIDLSNINVGMGTREAVEDIARNLDRWCDLIMVRTFGQDRAEAIARETEAPVINALTDLEHPCQVLGDFMTLMSLEGTRDLRGFPLAYVGDGNNVCHSLMALAASLGLDFRVASPDTYEPRGEYIKWATAESKKSGGKFTLTSDPYEAVTGAKAVYTDIWASMGQEHERGERLKVFQSYQLNQKLLNAAAKGAYAMHDLPAKRGEEITDEVIDGPTSIVYLQAEHRLHAQKGVMVWLAERAGVTAYR